MRAFSLFAALAILSLTAVPASAQNRGEVLRLRPTLNSPVAPQGNAGEVRRITVRSSNMRRVPRLRSNRGLRVNQLRRLRTRRLGGATPRLRTLRAPEGRFVRRNGSYFRVTPSRLRR